jgi:hypothetical protein
MRFAHQRAGELLAAVMADFERAYDRFGSHSVSCCAAGFQFGLCRLWSWLCENSSARRARRSISKKLRTMESNRAARTMFDTLSENCIFYISPMYEFSHRLGHVWTADCVAGHVGLELRNVAANYPFERSRRFAGGPAEFSRQRLFAFGCGVDTQVGPRTPRQDQVSRNLDLGSARPILGRARSVGRFLLNQ